jgi:drug/metabolite transporter (DMT)-like permease
MHMLMLVVVVCWASNIIAGKEALKGFNALALAYLRVLGAAAVFWIGFLASGRIRRLHLSRRQVYLLLAMAANGIALNQLTFIGGMARTTVAHTGLIVALGPVMVLVIAVVLRMEALTAAKFLGMLIAFAGVAILTSDKAGQGNGGHWVGDLILLASTLVFAVYIVLMKEIANDFDGLTLSALTFGLGAGMMSPFCTGAVVRTDWAGLRWESWCGLAFLVVFGSVISYLLFAYVMTELTASRAAAFNYLQPVIASGLGIWLLSEHLTRSVLIGGGLILAGVYLTERDRGDEKAPDPPVPEVASLPNGAE